MNLDDVLRDLRAGRLPPEAVELLRAALASLEPVEWTTKSAAARALGITLETLRGRCNRATAPVPTRIVAGRELVDMRALERDLAASPPRPTRTNASGSNRANPRQRGDAKA